MYYEEKLAEQVEKTQLLLKSSAPIFTNIRTVLENQVIIMEVLNELLIKNK